MTSIWRAARKVLPHRTISSIRTPTPPRFLSTCTQLQQSPSRPICNESFKQQRTNPSGGVRQEIAGRLPLPAVLGGLFGFGLLNEAFADSKEEAAGSSPLAASDKAQPPLESVPALSLNELQDIARREKARLEELLRRSGSKSSFCPRFTVSAKGENVSFRFQVPPSCEVPLLISKLVSRLGVNAPNAVGSDMNLRVWDSGVSWQLALTRPKRDNANSKGQAGDDGSDDLCILLFRPLITSEKTEIEFIKQGSFTTEELEALADTLQLAGQPSSSGTKYRGDAARVPSMDKTMESLEGMGIKVYGLKQSNQELSDFDISWDNIAGYEYQKREIEDTILLALRRPEVYDDIAHGTRRKFETNRPRAVLFEGPPGTGKTSCARVIANQTGIPLLYVPLEVIVSKYYGESERLLGKVFSLADDFPNGAIVFLDEIDSVATSRDNETHEATRRLLSVLLRQIDGFEQDKQVVVIAATNRKQDLDAALRSRFDSSIFFGLPDQQTREAIMAQYAKHLTKSEIAEIADATEGMSGRDIRDLCQQAERRWASKIIRGQARKTGDEASLPPLNEYIESATKRRLAMEDHNKNRSSNPSSGKPDTSLILSC